MTRFMLLSVALVVVLAQTAVATPILVNGDFEEPVIDGYTLYTEPYGTLDPAAGVPGWTLADTIVTDNVRAGLAKNGANGMVFNGQGAFLGGLGWLSQSIDGFMAGTFSLGFYNTAPALSLTPRNPLQVTLDDTVLTFGGASLVTPPSNTSSWITSNPISIDAGTHVLKFAGTSIVINPYLACAGIDGVVISGTSVEGVPEPGSILLLSTGLIGLLCYAWRKCK